jgi:hypothetical protein
MKFNYIYQINLHEMDLSHPSLHSLLSPVESAVMGRYVDTGKPDYHDEEALEMICSAMETQGDEVLSARIVPEHPNYMELRVVGDKFDIDDYPFLPSVGEAGCRFMKLKQENDD